MTSMMHCDHTPRESKRGLGPCQIGADVKQRNGKPKHWCSVHGMAASRPDGSAMDACPAAWAPPVPPELCLQLDLADGEIAMWGVVQPALAWGDPPVGDGKIHVHRRPTAGAKKDIDGSYDLIDVFYKDRKVQIEVVAAKARSISTLMGVPVVALPCPHCHEVHIDELMFATRTHSMHQCNGCGRNFRDRTGPSISNPLADLFTLLGLPRPPAPQRAARTIDLRLEDYAAVALWPSNEAFLSTMTRPEETGIHVHAWSGDKAVGEPDIDETYGTVTVNGITINEDTLRRLAVQRELADGAPIISRDCDHCRAPLVSPATGWMQPGTTHTCACRGTTRTRRKVFLNPLADKF